MTSGKNKDLLTGSRVVEFFEDKINYTTKIIDTNYQWEAVTSLKESDLCFYLYTGSNQALIIPKSAFKDGQQQREFEDLINRKVKI
ncbi:MAG: YcxB family protein [Saprospiraceae bacterium]